MPKHYAQVTLRVMHEWLPRADALIPKLSARGIDTNRTDVLRLALGCGLTALENTPTPEPILVRIKPKGKTHQ